MSRINWGLLKFFVQRMQSYNDLKHVSWTICIGVPQSDTSLPTPRQNH